MATARKTRERIGSLSSGNQTGPYGLQHNYYDEVSHWWESLIQALAIDGLQLADTRTPEFFNREGSMVKAIVDDEGNQITHVYFTYYRMGSGRWEIVNYLTQ